MAGQEELHKPIATAGAARRHSGDATRSPSIAAFRHNARSSSSECAAAARDWAATVNGTYRPAAGMSAARAA